MSVETPAVATSATPADRQTLFDAAPGPEERQALLEAVIYVADDPPTIADLAAGLGLPASMVKQDLKELIESYRADGRGIEIRAVAGGYKMFTKPEHHEAVKAFVKTLRPKLRLSLPALETLAVIAYKQPVTVPEIQAVRGVNAAGVIHTLLKHRLIATAGRKKIIGRPMQYKTTKDFLIQFGLNDLTELPSLKEMEEISRAALGEDDSKDNIEAPAEENAPKSPAEAEGAGVES